MNERKAQSKCHLLSFPPAQSTIIPVYSCRSHRSRCALVQCLHGSNSTATNNLKAHENTHTAFDGEIFIILSQADFYAKNIEVQCYDACSIIQVRKCQKVDSVHLDAAFSASRVPVIKLFFMFGLNTLLKLCDETPVTKLLGWNYKGLGQLKVISLLTY